MLPKFCLKESWDVNCGDVEVYFEDQISSDLFDYMRDELSKVAPLMPEEEKNVYHLEQVIGGIFSQAAVQKRLIRKNNQWTITRL